MKNKMEDGLGKLTRLLVVIFYISSLFIIPLRVEANNELHLEFHMGVALDGDFFVGGTLRNKGYAEVYKGFVVITPIDSLCYPQKPIIWDFSSIPSGESLDFKIPVKGSLHGYKLNTVYAMDNMGNKVDIVDETADVIAKKHPTYVEKCLSLRGPVF